MSLTRLVQVKKEVKNVKLTTNTMRYQLLNTLGLSLSLSSNMHKIELSSIQTQSDDYATIRKHHKWMMVFSEWYNNRQMVFIFFFILFIYLPVFYNKLISYQKKVLYFKQLFMKTKELFCHIILKIYKEKSQDFYAFIEQLAF